MTFDSTEKSVALAAPVELYKFIGTYDTYRYTSNATSITNSDGTYAAETIKRNKLKNANQEETNLAIEIELPANNQVVIDHVFSTSPPSLQLEFYRCHLNDVNDTLLMWKGEVLAWSIDGRVGKLKVPNFFSYTLGQPCPPVKYQAPCNHILYGTRCAVDPTSFTHTTTVSSFSGNTVVIATNPFADDLCNAGEMIVNSERRMIIDNTGTSFTLASEFSNISNSDAVTIRQGCDHSFTTCKDKFSNGANFGGFPLVPDNNPFASRI